MPFCAENVCLEVDDSGTGLYAVGSRSHVTLIDSRLASSQPPPTAFRSPDKDCGVRSLNFNSGLLSMGTGAGHVYFYDMRARAYLLEDELTYKKCFLHSTPGWLVSSYCISYYRLIMFATIHHTDLSGVSERYCSSYQFPGIAFLKE